ncbi:hypothetical protein RJD24_07890 [Bacillaceae bacterium IKA-2]|nr:hypothetical protein RJD24_07890 [Bacillaceae bacterium IKA-2]
MVRLFIYIMVVILSSSVIGCVQGNRDINEEQDKENPIEEQNKENPISVEEEKSNKVMEFSYIEALPEERIKEYELFANEKDSSHLENFSPEQIVLVYIHSAIIDDIEGIYTITNNDGTLPEFEVFKTEYYKSHYMYQDLDLALRFRYYHTIETQEENEDIQLVTMKVSIGTFTDSVMFKLEKDNNVWKMEIYPFILQNQ